MVKRILVGLGGTAYAEAKIQCAMELAQRFDADVTGVTVFNEHSVEDIGPVPVGGGASATDLREHRVHEVETALETAIEHFTGECKRNGTKHHVIRERGNPFEQLTELWRYHDLTILGLCGMFEYGVLDDVKGAATKLLAGGVRPIIATTAEHHPVKRALIAYNGSMESAKAMKRFVQMRLWPGAEVCIATFGRDENAAHQLLHDARDYCSAFGIDAESEYVADDPRHALLAYAHDKDADVIVMGCTNRSRLSKLVLGDTAEHLLQESDLPLFLAQ